MPDGSEILGRLIHPSPAFDVETDLCTQHGWERVKGPETWALRFFVCDSGETEAIFAVIMDRIFLGLPQALEHFRQVREDNPTLVVHRVLLLTETHNVHSRFFASFHEEGVHIFAGVNSADNAMTVIEDETGLNVRDLAPIELLARCWDDPFAGYREVV